MSKRCLGCMKMKESSPICEHCGYNENVPNYPNQLPVGMLLHEQYTIGKVLGQGGFGITYIGWDHSLETAVAIKEFFPRGIVNRDCQYSYKVSCNGEGAEAAFLRNKERFLKEAKILAKVQNVPGIVRVQNLFSENNTIYIVMEYAKGIDLRQYIQMKNRALTVEETFSVMRPIINAMHKVHGAELVHRDISPDNIMMLTDGTVKLLDFGAARVVEHAQVGEELPESTEAILKHGFAPIEQYSRRGNLGPWTDVYALCATIYYCLTGRMPNAASERVMGDDNVNWRSIPGLTEQQMETLEKGLALLPENRLQSMEQLYRGLFEKQTGVSAPVKVQKQPAPAAVEPPKKKKKTAPLIAAALAAVAVVATAVGLFFLKPKEEAPAVSAPETTPAIVETTEPVVTVSPEDRKRYDEAVALEESGKKAEAAMAFGALGDLLDARQRSFDLWAEVTERKTIAAGCDYTAAVKKDGTVVFDGWMDENWQGIEQWENIIALSASISHLVGLKDDGTVVAAGRNQDGQCDVSQWRDIVAIACGESHTVGLKSDGTVVAVGNNIYYEQNIHRLDVERWEEIVAISADTFNTVGIRTDGTVIVTGYFGNWEQKTVIDWTDIVGISAGNWHVAGVKSDGTAVAGGDDAYQRCYVDNWTDIVAVSTGYFHTLGLRSDGTVVAVGRNTDNFAKPCGQCNVKEWKNVVDIDAGWYHSVALCADGTVLVTGREIRGGSWGSWKEWKDILLPGEKLQKEEPVVMENGDAAYAEAESLLADGKIAEAAIAFGKLAGYKDARERSISLWAELPRKTFDVTYRGAIALKTDGTVVMAFTPAENDEEKATQERLQNIVSGWTDIVSVSNGNGSWYGLKCDGTVVSPDDARTVEWQDILRLPEDDSMGAVDANGCIVGMSGSNEREQAIMAEWTDVVMCGNERVVRCALKSDGTVVSTGPCYYCKAGSTWGWSDVVSICAADHNIIGLRADGTLLVTGCGDGRQLDAKKWKDIIAIAASGTHTVGLKSDGTVVAAGNNVSGQCDVSEWTDIVAIDAGSSVTAGLKANGMILVTGGSEEQIPVGLKEWTDIQIP